MLPHVFHHRIKTKGHLLTHVAFKVLFIQNHLKHIQDAIEKLKSYENQVWPLTKFISVFFFVKIIDLPGGPNNDSTSTTAELKTPL